MTEQQRDRDSLFDLSSSEMWTDLQDTKDPNHLLRAGLNQSKMNALDSSKAFHRQDALGFTQLLDQIEFEDKTQGPHETKDSFIDDDFERATDTDEFDKLLEELDLKEKVKPNRRYFDDDDLQ